MLEGLRCHHMQQAAHVSLFKFSNFIWELPHGEGDRSLENLENHLVSHRTVPPFQPTWMLQGGWAISLPTAPSVTLSFPAKLIPEGLQFL